MSRNIMKVAVIALSYVLLAFALAGGAAQSAEILTDADAGVAASGLNPSDATPFEPQGDSIQIRTHFAGANRHSVGYLHFNLGSLNGGGAVTEARLILDLLEFESFGTSNTAFFAITDETKDWDLNTLPESVIDQSNAPQLNYTGTSHHTSDAEPSEADRMFLDEGTGAGDATRFLGIGAAGIANGTFSVPNAVDLDVTQLIQWAVGDNPGYATGVEGDDQLTIVFRGAEGPNSYIHWVTKENTGGMMGARLNVTQVPIPEPSTVVLLALGGLGLWLSAGRRLRRRRVL